MKKIAFIALLLFCGSMYSQKKKKAAAAPTSTVVAKVNNLSAELVKNNFYLFINNGAKKDTLLLKKYEDKGSPAECKITTFTTKGVSMYCVTWVEKTVNETKLKKEESTITNSQVWNPATKILMIGNMQTSIKIKETVFLDKLKNASETQERMRNEGYQFTLLGDGDFTLKNKSSETKYSLNTTSMRYEAAKVSASAGTTPAKKKKK